MMPVPALAPTSKKSIKELARGFDKTFGEKKKKKKKIETENQRPGETGVSSVATADATSVVGRQKVTSRFQYVKAHVAMSRKCEPVLLDMTCISIHLHQMSPIIPKIKEVQ
mmetsp:Transcript_3935/g.6026  ORF Transcript_3935/g.6026 Transcript_3935/m.6026 type:complete len:111 (+) Transcript_3935:1987-2319(+)